MEKEGLLKKIDQLEKEKAEIVEELQGLKRKPEGKIGYLLIILGITLLSLSIFYSHNVAAYIGIALTFWGALLLYIRPTQFIRKEILDSTVSESIDNYYKLIEELGYKGTPQYISPSTLWGLRNAVIYIPKSDHTLKPTDEQLSANEIIINDPQAIKLTPPGHGLSRLIEDELKTNFSTLDVAYLHYNLEKALVEGLEIAKSYQMESIESRFHVEIRGAVFYEMAKKQSEYDKVRYIGDPLNSAIACILARTTKRTIIIENIQTEPRERMIITNFKIIEPS